MLVVSLSSAQRVAFTYFGGACVVLEAQSYAFVFDPADHLTDEDISRMSGTVVTLFTQHLDDHFHERTAMKLVEMRGSLVIGTSEVYGALASFMPSMKLVELKPRRGIRVGPVRIYALEGRHSVPTNLYYVTWGPSVLFAGDTGYVQLPGLRAQLAFLPAGGSPHSTPESASSMAVEVGARYVVPVHCSSEEARRLSELLTGKAAVIVPSTRVAQELSLPQD